MPYRIRTHKLFLTYPQCDVPLNDIYQHLFNTFQPLHLLVAHELHANGDLHRHCYLEKQGSEDAWSFTSPGFADLPSGHHGNYQAVRSDKNVLKYCIKKDDYICDPGFDVDGRIKAKKSHKKYIGEELLLKKRSLAEVVMANPELIYDYDKLRKNLGLLKNDLDDIRLSLPVFLPNPWSRCFPSRRNSKRRHYWIYSREPNVGKTTKFLLPLAQDYRVHIKTSEYVYWNLRGSEECIALDEYNSATLKFHQLNSLADGTFDFRIFHGGLLRLDNPLIIICSNQSISDLYPIKNELLLARFNEFEVKP